jgi:8-oxo-dGTP pyrophosphatase MutT (NUDIX family)
VADEPIGAIKTISSREVYRNKWTSVREDILEYPDGRRGLYGVVDKDPACIVIAIEHGEDGEFLWLVRQFRYTVGGTYYELPQGGWEQAAVDIEAMARGELAEETGLRAERMTHLGGLWIGYGVMRQVQHVFVAEGLSQGDTAREAEEQGMTVHRVAVREFEAMLLDGRVMDNCSAAAWGLYRVWRDRQRAGNKE